MKRVLITGAAGFIGSHLAEFYLKKNNLVTGIDNFSTGTKKNVERLSSYSQFCFFQHDITQEWKDFDFLQQPFDLVFHLASPAAVNQYQVLSLETMWSNSVGLKHALEFATQKNARLIFSSTSEIYGSPSIHPQPENYWGEVNSFGERSCYDESKRFGETLIYSWNQRHKTQHGLVRIFNTYGPFMNPHDGRVIIQFLRQALANQSLTIYGQGKQTRSFCYIDDLILGLVAYANSNLTSPVNLGNDNEITIRQLAETLIQLFNSKSKLAFMDLPQDDPPQRCPDLAVARQKLNYHPKISLEEGLQQLFQAEFKPV